MACFLVPAAEAVITTVVAKAMKSKEEKAKISCGCSVAEGDDRMKFSEKLGWLNKLLWGGSALLAFEHVWHGEIIPTFPFLTAVQTGETAEMLAEMTSAGTTMAVLITVVWCGMLAVSAVIEKRADAEAEIVEGGVQQ